MLNVDTKRRIDAARDILVGKLPDPKSQVEQITIALIYKFMDDMDKEAQELGGKPKFFSGEFKKYAWSKIFDPRVSGVELVNVYGEAIQRMNQNPNIPQLFRDIFKNAYLPYRDPETLKSFLKSINDFQYDHSERLGDAFEYLLSVLGSQGEAGQFRTPRHIIDFMVEIIDPKKNESILDPACGTAGFLISSYKHILKHNSKNFDADKDPRAFELHGVKLEEITINSKKYRGGKLNSDDKERLANNIIGYDISPDMVRLSLVNMYLHGFSNPKIFEYDTLTSESKWNEYADVIMANPPFMSPKGGIRPHKRFSVESKRSEVLFVDYIAEHLTPQGRTAVIVPEGIIFQTQTAYKNLRKMLIEKNYLVGVISLPAGVFNPYSGVKTSILWLDRTLAKKIDKILFVKIENDGFDLGAQRRPIEKNDLPEAFRTIGTYKDLLFKGKRINVNKWQNALVVEKKKIAESGDYNLGGERYKIEDVIDANYPLKKIDGLFTEIRNGINVKQSDHQGKYRVTRIQTIADGIVNLDKTKWTNDKVSADRFMEDGDILLSHINSFEHLAKSAIFTDSTKKVVHGINLIRFRPDKKLINPKFAIHVFKSNIFLNKARSFAQRAVNQASIKTADLKSISIPLPPLSVQEEIVGEIKNYQKIIYGARQVIENYKPHIDINPDWPVAELGKICELMTGGTPKSTEKKYYENGTIKWLVSGDIHKGEIFDCRGRITKLGMKESNAKILPVNSVLIALNGQGKTRGTVALLRTKATCNQSLVSIEPIDKTKLLSEFLFIVLNGRYQEIRNITGDNQRSGLNMSIVRALRIPLPSIDIQKKIIEEIWKQQKAITANKELMEVFKQKIKDRIAKIWGEK